MPQWLQISPIEWFFMALGMAWLIIIASLGIGAICFVVGYWLRYSFEVVRYWWLLRKEEKN